MLGFDITKAPFSWKFRDMENDDVNWVNTFDSTMVFADKYV